ncbi:gelsolin-related protein of 125 kDa [Spatholobus suberectus]|nr:gelsolin-related protein of 125 kDa [Spatholobus suberectus]
MGIGNSRLNAAEGDVVPAKIRPMLVGRFEEFKKRRNEEGTLSKKKLLKDADEEDDNSQSSRLTEREDNKVPSPKEIQPLKEETVVRAIITTEKLSRVVPMPNSECKIVQENHPNKGNIQQVNKDMDPNQDKVNQMAEAEVKTEEGNTVEPVEEPKREKEQEVGAKGDGDSDDEDDSEEDGRFLRPGSPSFRIYCIEAEKRNEEERNIPTIIMHQKSRSADSVERVASGNSNEVLQDVDIESESTPKRKGNKKKFGAMKTLLKLKSCYHPMCTCTGEDKSLTVTAKAAK